MRSIPAHTGEPAQVAGGETVRRVYPRTYGGTTGTRQLSDGTQGLSPHIRGNR